MSVKAIDCSHFNCTIQELKLITTDRVTISIDDFNCTIQELKLKKFSVRTAAQ